MVWAKLDDVLRVRYAASVAPVQFFADITVQALDGSVETVEIAPFTTFTTNRGVAAEDGDRVRTSAGRVIAATMSGSFAGVKRGQFYAQMVLLRPGVTQLVCKGYVYAENIVQLGDNEEMGPGGGNGFLSWEPAFTADRAGNAAAVDFSLAASNAFRKVYGIAWYYHASSDVADRIFNAPALVNLGGATPTGFTTTGNNALFWNTGANITLSADQEGAHISLATEGKDGRTVTNDQGVQSIASTAGAPTPWPLKVDEDELGVLRFPAITDGEAADRHSAYVLMEEWIQP